MLHHTGTPNRRGDIFIKVRTTRKTDREEVKEEKRRRQRDRKRIK